MRYLIDGNNVIGHERGLSLADDESRAVLIRALCAWARARRKRVTVVFDGPAPHGPARSDLGDVKVLYAGGGRTASSADDRILRLLEREARPAEVTVVTSDGPLANRARARGAAILRCHEFRPLLREAASAEAEGPEKPAHVDVAEWTAYFARGRDPERGP